MSFTGLYILVFQNTCHLMNTYLGPVRDRVMVTFQWKYMS